MKQIKDYYEFMDKLENSINSGRDTYVFANLDYEGCYFDCWLDIEGPANEFYVKSDWNMEELQYFLFVKYNKINKSNDYNICLDWIYDEEICYRRLFIFKNTED